eukprot:8323846-Ditylum_brightwellii.AAC.1
MACIQHQTWEVNFEHGWKITVDKHIFWGFARNQPGGGHKCDHKPQGVGPEYKCLSAVGLNATTTFEHVCGKKHNNERRYTKEYGAGAAVVLQLCEAAGIQGTNRVVMANLWFGGIHLPKDLMTIGLHNISNIKLGSVVFCKKELQEKLMGDNVECGAHAIATTTIDGLKLTALAYRDKFNCHRKSKAKKSNFYSYYIATDCCTTWSGKSAGKRHYPYGSRDPFKLIPWCNMVEEYYDGMPARVVVNRNAQFFLGIKETIKTTDIKIRIACSVIDDGTRQRGGVNVTLDPKTTDPFVYSCMTFKDVIDISRQQRCSMCNAEGRAKMTSVYCGLCTVMADRDVDCSPTYHACCAGGTYQYFQCH